MEYHLESIIKVLIRILVNLLLYIKLSSWFAALELVFILLTGLVLVLLRPSRRSSLMRVRELCWGSNRSERPETRTSTSAWHATARERCLSLQSWPLSEVRRTTIPHPQPPCTPAPNLHHFPLNLRFPFTSPHLSSAVVMTTPGRQLRMWQ